jgi:hypothetical protein
MVMSEQELMARLAVIAALTSDEQHARPEEIEAAALGAANDHIGGCAMCAAEVDDLRKLVRKHSWWWAAAAVAAGVAIVALLWPQQKTAEIVPMRREPLQLRGPSASSSLDVVEPLAVVASDRPTFRWTAPAGTAVSVQVFDEQFRPVADSGPTTAREWTPAQPLPRGKTLLWQIRTADGTIAPAPPLPEARFRVVSESDNLQ